jgi:RecA-family ATPase
VVIPLDLQRIARSLGGEVRNGQILAPGPGHSPKDRSMSVRLDPGAPDGFIVHSFAPHDDVIKCRDYVRERCGLPAFGSNGKRQTVETVAPTRQVVDDATIAAALAAIKTMPSKPTGKIVKTYDYTDEGGTLLYQVVRLDPKDFRQRRLDADGKWIWNLNGVRRVPYRLPDLIKYPFGTTFVTEGEKDSDRLAENDLCATTVASGAWDDVDISALAGRDVMILEDNDDAGRKKAFDVATLLHGVAATVRIIRLPGLPERGDVSDWLDDAGHTADELAEFCFDQPLWKSGNEPPTPPPTSKPTPAPDAPADQIAPLPFISILGWHGEPVPEREWCVLNRVPMRNVTLFSGEGAIGKSIVSLQLSIAHILGEDWLGTMPTPGPALVVACEDDGAELHRRIFQILEHYGASFADLKDLHLISLAGEDALLATPEKNGLIKPTKLFDRLKQAACDIRPKLIVLDNSADVFGGSENDRAQVRQFIGILRGLAIVADAGVLLTSHPSLTGISTNTGLSGSTAWNASVRSRLYMKRATTEKDEEPDPNLRVIEVMKSNYGPVGETIMVRWKDGIFLPEAGTFLDKLAAEQKADQIFCDQVAQYTRQGRNVSIKPNAPSYAPTEFAKEQGAREAGIKKRDFEAAMRRLLTAGKIRVESYGPPSRGWTRLVIT